MKWVGLSFCMALLLMGCATNSQKSDMSAIYNKYDTHCRDYARQMAGEANEEDRYRECMDYFIKSDIPNCPYCVIKSQ